MNRTCTNFRRLQIAALAGVCMLGTSAMAQTKAKVGVASKLQPTVKQVVRKSPLKAGTLYLPSHVDGDVVSRPGATPRGPGGACVIPGGGGCVLVGSAQECTDQFGTFQGVGSACPVMLCANVTSCQAFEYPRVGGTSFASMGAPSAQPLMVAEDFQTSSGGPHSLTEICWWGTYTGIAPLIIDCANPAPMIDAFQIRVFELVAGLPDIAQVVATLDQGVNMSINRRHICDGGNRVTYEYHATLSSAVSLAGNRCYAIEIRNPNDGTANWFWSRARDATGFPPANNQCWQRSGEVAYTNAGIQTGDRAFCMNIPLNINQTSCAVPPPPICTNPDSNGYVRLAANTGLFSADPSAPGVGLQLANSLQFATSAPITNVCFWGFWVAPDGTQPTGPDTPDFWFTIFDSDGPDGLPGTELARGHCGTDSGYVARRLGANYNIAFPAFTPEPNHCYHFSISFPQDNNDPLHAFRFAWGAASTIAPDNPLSNFYCASRIAFPAGAWAFQNFGNPDIAETSMVFDQPGVLPSCGAPPPPPPAPENDNCAASFAIAGTGTFNYDNRAATCEVGERPLSCATSGNSIWYTWTAPCNGDFVISLCDGSADDTTLAAYDGTDCANSPEMACDDDGCGIGGGPSIITISAVAGNNYLVRVGNWAAAECGTSIGAQGTFSITRNGGDCPTACPCDWNNSGTLNSQDFFDFLTSFFGGNADFNNNGVTNSQDFFDFLSCFFTPPAGC